MSVSASRKAHDTGIVIATFGGFPTLPGLGIFLLKALPKLNRWLSGVPLDSSEKESLRGAFRSYRITLTRPILGMPGPSSMAPASRERAVRCVIVSSGRVGVM